MLATVVNIKAEEYDVYIGRGRGSKWGNPFTHKQGTKAKFIVSSRDEAVSKYEEWFFQQPHLIRDLHELKGKRLGCYCKPAACHGDVLCGICNAFLVVVAGGRTFKDYDLMQKKLDHYFARVKKEIIIISGTAGGADKLGERYAKDRGLRCLRLPAEWDKYGRSAGYRRNEDMARIANASVCFWNGSSPGTGHMVDLSRKYDLQLRVVGY